MNDFKKKFQEIREYWLIIVMFREYNYMRDNEYYECVGDIFSYASYYECLIRKGGKKIVIKKSFIEKKLFFLLL